MKETTFYLKQNVVLEPLVNQWYAWSYLISPATAAMYISHSHLKIMESFIRTPQVHIAALKNPKMMGGPFINYGVEKVDEIKQLMETTKIEKAPIIELSQAISSLEKMLSNEASGYSLESIYSQIPDSLKGYVELVYDLNNRPSMRLIEGLLYKSKYYDQSSQSIVLYLIDDQTKRSFAFSTPRLLNKQHLQIKIPFSSEGIDQLCAMRTSPNSLFSIKEKLGIKNEDEELFSSFFIEDAAPKNSQYSDDSVRIRYFGHACVLIESNNISILCDPLISYKDNHDVSRYTYADLPETIDYVLITHNHQDHCLFETLLQLRYKIKNIIVPKNNGGALADPSLKLVLQNIGFQNVKEIDEMESINLDEGLIMGLPFMGEHADLNIRTKIAYWVRLKEYSILLAADSNNLESKLYQYINQLLGDVDVMFLGMECDGAPLSWLYGSLLTNQLPRKMDQSRRLDGSNSDKALDMVKILNPKQVYVYAMGQESWLTFITSIQYTEDSRPITESNKLIESCRKQGIISERLLNQKEIVLN